MPELGDRLRRYRKKAGLSIYDVEKLTGRHFSTISKYERGERRPNIDVLRELAGVYEVLPATLMTGVDDVKDMLPDEVIAAARILETRQDIFDLLPYLDMLDYRQVRALASFLDSLSHQ